MRSVTGEGGTVEKGRKECCCEDVVSDERSGWLTFAQKRRGKDLPSPLVLGRRRGWV